MNARSLVSLVSLCLGTAFASPPGSPMSEFGPSQVSAGIFYDHSGQNLFEEKTASGLNQIGLSLDYAPIPYVQGGVFGGGQEFDVAASRTHPSSRSFDGDYAFFGGASAKLATPRFLKRTARVVAFGAGTYFDNEDKYGNAKSGIMYNAGGSFQVLFGGKLNLALGGEFYAFDGSQKSSAGSRQSFGLNASDGALDYLRALVGVDYFLEGPNHPFISVAFRPSRSLGWDDDLGLKGASVSICFGAIATLHSKGSASDDGDGFFDP